MEWFLGYPVYPRIISLALEPKKATYKCRTSRRWPWISRDIGKRQVKITPNEKCNVTPGYMKVARQPESNINMHIDTCKPLNIDVYFQSG